MPVTGLFFVPSSSPDLSPAHDLIYRLNSAFEATQTSQWGLACHLFRETPSSAQGGATLNGPDNRQSIGRQRVLQILTLSHHIPKTYVMIAASQAAPQARVGTPVASQQNGEEAKSKEPATIISIPSGSQKEEFVQLIATKFGPLWQLRQVLHVAHGATFEVGDFRIRIGDLKPGAPSAGNTQKPRGAVCEIEWIDTENTQPARTFGYQETYWQIAEPIIKEFWDSLEVNGARQVFSVADLGDELSTARQWFDILPQRSQ